MLTDLHVFNPQEYEKSGFYYGVCLYTCTDICTYVRSAST
jgi:hypothetical protein